MANKLNADPMDFVSEDDSINTYVECKDKSRAQREKKKREAAAKDAKIVQLTDTVTTQKEKMEEKDKMISELQRGIGERDRIIGEKERKYAELLYSIMATQHTPALDLGQQQPTMMLGENTYLSQHSDLNEVTPAQTIDGASVPAPNMYAVTLPQTSHVPAPGQKLGFSSIAKPAQTFGAAHPMQQPSGATVTASNVYAATPQQTNQVPAPGQKLGFASVAKPAQTIGAAHPVQQPSGTTVAASDVYAATTQQTSHVPAPGQQLGFANTPAPNASVANPAQTIEQQPSFTPVLIQSKQQ